MASIDYIRRHYGLDVKRGTRFRFDGKSGPPTEGVVVGSRNGLLRVRFDGSKRVYSLHPTWKITYPR